MKAIHRCAYMKNNVVYGRNRYFYVLIWNIAGSSTRDRNIFMSFHSLRYAPLVKKHKISITRGRSTGLPYQRMKEPIRLFIQIYAEFLKQIYACIIIYQASYNSS
jgi:hypothetical protein